jgi:hypothetical protein
MAVVFIAVNAYFINAAGLYRWLYCMVVFPVRYYPSVSLNNWRVYGQGLYTEQRGASHCRIHRVSGLEKA